MKKIITVIVLLFSIFSLVGCSNKVAIEYPDYDKTQNIAEEYLAEKEFLTVGISKGYSQYLNFRKTDDIYEYYGGEAFLANYLAKKMGLEVKFVDQNNINLVPGLTSKDYDIALCNIKYDTKYNDVYASISYNPVDTYILTNGSSSLNDKKVGVVSNSLQYDLAETISGIESIETYANSRALLQALLENQVSGVLLNEVDYLNYIEKDEYKNLTVLEETLSSPYDGPVVYGNSEEIINVINTLIGELPEDGFNEWNDLDYGTSKTFFEIMISMVKKYSLKLVQGVGITLGLSFVTVFLGTVLGIIVTLIRRNKAKPIKFIAASYVELVRGIPLLLLLWFIYLAVPPKVPAIISVGAALFINSGAYVAEIIRAGINAVDKGQIEAARSLGMTNGQTMRKIVLPQAIRNILPALGNEFVTMIKETSLASVFFVGDLMTVKNQITSLTYLSLEPFIIVAIIYFVMTFSISKLIGKLERSLNK